MAKHKLNLVDCELADGSAVKLASSMRLLGIVEHKMGGEVAAGMDLLMGRVGKDAITLTNIQTAFYIFYLEGYIAQHNTLKGCADIETFMTELFPDDDQYVQDLMNQVVHPKATGDSATHGSKKQSD